VGSKRVAPEIYEKEIKDLSKMNMDYKKYF